MTSVADFLYWKQNLVLLAELITFRTFAIRQSVGEAQVENPIEVRNLSSDPAFFNLCTFQVFSLIIFFFFQQVYIAQIRRPTVPATPKQNGLVLTATEQVLTLVLEEREVQSVRKVFMIETRSIGGPTADLPPQWYRRIEKHPRAPPQGLIMGPRRQDDNIVH